MAVNILRRKLFDRDQLKSMTANCLGNIYRKISDDSTRALYHIGQLPFNVAVFKAKIAKEYEFGDWKHEPMIGDFINRFERGGRLPMHIDQNTDDRVSLRFNILVSRSEGGNFTVKLAPGDWRLIDDINEGDGLLFPAGRFLHTSSVVTSEKRRLLLSLGYSVTRNVADRYESDFRDFARGYLQVKEMDNAAV